MADRNLQSSKLPNKSEAVYKYVLDKSLRLSDTLKKCREVTETHHGAKMQTAADEGQLLAWLLRLMNAKRVIEVGVFTGYSSICMAEALPDDGLLIACDINEESTNIAKQLWKESGLDKKIQLHLRSAVDTLEELIQKGEENTFDFAYIDADKNNYDNYYELCLKLVRPGGVICVDNTLWSGEVINPENNKAPTVAIRKLNDKIYEDDRVDISFLAIADGVTLCLKK